MASFTPDLVIWEPHPPQAGFDACTRLREHPACAHARFIAYTGYAVPATPARVAGAGFAEFLIKSVPVTTLFQAMRD